MAPRPDVSIIIPAYRSEATLAEAVQSALDQDGVLSEVIVVIDGSPDRSFAVACDCAARDPRVRVQYQANQGVSAARNAGAATARGAWLAFLDADDWLAPGALAAHQAHFDARPEVGVSYGRVRFFDPAAPERAGRVSGFAAELRLPLIVGDNQVCTGSNIAVRKAAFADAGPFDARLRRAEDQDWLARMALTTDWRLAGLDRVTTIYRTSADGLSSDLGAMEADWRRLLAGVRAHDPQAFDAAWPEIHARFLRYAARRRLRLGMGTGQAAADMLAALRACPCLLAREPRRTGQTLIAALAALVLPKLLTRSLLAR